MLPTLFFDSKVENINRHIVWWKWRVNLEIQARKSSGNFMTPEMIVVIVSSVTKKDYRKFNFLIYFIRLSVLE